jgi:hypothetical protein
VQRGINVPKQRDGVGLAAQALPAAMAAELPLAANLSFNLRPAAATQEEEEKKVTALAPCCEGVNRFHFTQLIVRFHRARMSLTGATA